MRTRTKSKPTINVEVVYAKSDAQIVATVHVTQGTTVGQAIAQSHLLERIPEIDLMRQAVGIYGARVRLTDVVGEGDRIEIYRRLAVNPKEMRRARASRQRQAKLQRSRGR
jgi:putative ubiquitin-RnfH superfamily antitoxin RatB of RatAB toxin-antitoxin module